MIGDEASAQNEDSPSISINRSFDFILFRSDVQHWPELDRFDAQALIPWYATALWRLHCLMAVGIYWPIKLDLG